jgi:hypothetical protein
MTSAEAMWFLLHIKISFLRLKQGKQHYSEEISPQQLYGAYVKQIILEHVLQNWAIYNNVSLKE